MIGFLGGTGPEGRGLALRLALAGEDVIIGSPTFATGTTSYTASVANSVDEITVLPTTNDGDATIE